jgi:L,D-transpeptidase ErfK/SrfK
MPALTPRIAALPPRTGRAGSAPRCLLSRCAILLAALCLSVGASARPNAVPGLLHVGGEPAGTPVDRAIAAEAAIAVDADPVADLSATHVVARGEFLGLIGARYGVSTRLIATENRLDSRKPLVVGQQVSVTSRHVVPPPIDEGIVINLPQRMLFLFRAGRLARAFPIAIGRADWRTPTGEFTVINRQTDKTWIVPASIQEEMRREGRPVLTSVPPGPDNPLGRHWIGLSLPAIGIHGTNAPASVYGFRSHGCMRAHPDDIAELFDRVSVGERGRIVYLPLLLARGADGRIWFEANPDVYRMGAGTLETVRAMLRDRGIAEDSVDWPLIETMLRARDGLAREVGIDRDGSTAGRIGGG